MLRVLGLSRVPSSSESELAVSGTLSPLSADELFSETTDILGTVIAPSMLILPVSSDSFWQQTLISEAVSSSAALFPDRDSLSDSSNYVSLELIGNESNSKVRHFHSETVMEQKKTLPGLQNRILMLEGKTSNPGLPTVVCARFQMRSAHRGLNPGIKEKG